MRLGKLLIAAVAVSAISSAAWAQFGGGGGGGFGGGGGGRGGGANFGDPTQPREEDTPEEIAAEFDKADTNHDGIFSQQEYKATLSAALQSVADSLYQARDRNRDGQVSKAEYVNFGTSTFEGVDAAPLPETTVASTAAPTAGVPGVQGVPGAQGARGAQGAAGAQGAGRGAGRAGGAGAGRGGAGGAAGGAGFPAGGPPAGFAPPGN